jgi:ornithine carbamoyltransferase
MVTKRSMNSGGMYMNITTMELRSPKISEKCTAFVGDKIVNMEETIIIAKQRTGRNFSVN